MALFPQGQTKVALSKLRTRLEVEAKQSFSTRCRQDYAGGGSSEIVPKGARGPGDHAMEAVLPTAVSRMLYHTV